MKTTNKSLHDRITNLEVAGYIIIILFVIVMLFAAMTVYIIYLLDMRIIELETKPTIANHTTDAIIIEEKEKNEGVVEEEKYPITPEERELVTRIVIAESRGEPLEGQIAVAQVILDRWIKQGGSLNEVILAPKQFATPYPGDFTEYSSCWLATHLVFDLGYRVFEEPTLFFFNPITSEPSQIELLRNYTLRGSIGNHEFRGVD